MAISKGKNATRHEVAPFVHRMAPSMFGDMDRLFESLLGRSFGSAMWPGMRWPEQVEMTYPSVDVFEDEDNVFLKAEIPGVKKEDLEVNITESEVSIRGEKQKLDKVQEKDYHRVERTYGSFARTFTLPVEVQNAKASAKFTDGVLEIKIPKSKASKTKTVKVDIK